MVEQTGLPFSRIRILSRLSRRSMTVKQVAHAATMDAPAATVAVNDLEERGLVVRETDPTNRRCKVVSLTDAGRAMVRKIDAVDDPAPEVFWPSSTTPSSRHCSRSRQAVAEIAFPVVIAAISALGLAVDGTIGMWRCRAGPAAPNRGTAPGSATRVASPITAWPSRAEYKQVTVLFADVVGSMDIAAALGAERLARSHGRIGRPLVEDCSALRRHSRQVHRRRDHGGVRCADCARGPRRPSLPRGARHPSRRQAAWATTLEHRDQITLQLRVGLNSGEVIAGEIGSGPLGYTAIGEQVGMAQRMESVAPPAG